MAFCSLHHPEYRPTTISYKDTTLERMVCSQSKCPICGLILEAVEDYMPGWIISPKNVRTHISIRIVDYGQKNFQTVHFRKMLIERLGQVDWKNDFSFNVIQRPLRRNGRLEFRPLCHPSTCCDQGQLIHAQKDPEPPSQLPAPSETMWEDICRNWDVVEDSTTKAAFDRAAGWLSQCMKYDAPCKPPDVNFNPRRLLSVKQAGEPFLMKPTRPTAYACLSYCWGELTENVLRTTKSNIQSHYREIPVDSMPKSVQDAVNVCRGLNIPYLWVDSLCIVQDDANAWHHDASMMDRIYLNAQLTITALEPSSCKMGFLGKQRFGLPGWQHQLTLQDTSQEVLIRPEPKNEEYSLNKRGWCLQEALLSQRSLCFDGNEMSWECSCRKVCECGHCVWQPITTKHGRDELSLMELGALLRRRRLPLADYNIDNVHHQHLDYVAGIRSKESFAGVNELWRKVVSDYSQRSLSRQSDKLVALAGLARIISRSQNGDLVKNGYITGLWKNSFCFDLAWRAATFKSSPNSTGREGFPSWSWTSYDGAIDYDYLSDWDLTTAARPSITDMCFFRGVKGIHADGSPTAEGVRITLQGNLVPVEPTTIGEHIHQTSGMTQNSSPESCFTLRPVQRPSLRLVKIYLDRPVSSIMRQDDAQASCQPNGRCNKQGCWWKQEQNDTKAAYYYFSLFTCKKQPLNLEVTDKKNESNITWFLILRGSCRVEGAFERIGIGIWNEQKHSYEDPSLFPIDTKKNIYII